MLAIVECLRLLLDRISGWVAPATTSGICAAHLGKRARLPQHPPHSGHAAAALVAAHGVALCSGWFPLQQEGVWQVRGRWRRGSGSGRRQEPRCRLRPAWSADCGTCIHHNTQGSLPAALQAGRGQGLVAHLLISERPTDQRLITGDKAASEPEAAEARERRRGMACAGQTGWARYGLSPTPEPMIGLLQRHGGCVPPNGDDHRFGFMRAGHYFCR